MSPKTNLLCVCQGSADDSDMFSTSAGSADELDIIFEDTGSAADSSAVSRSNSAFHCPTKLS